MVRSIFSKNKINRAENLLLNTLHLKILKKNQKVQRIQCFIPKGGFVILLEIPVITR